MKGRPEVLMKLYHPKFKNDVVLAEIKQNSGSIAQFKKILKPALQHLYTKHIFKNNLFPKSLEDIKKAKPLPSTNSLAGEAGWALHSILEHKEAIQSFIGLKNDFERKFLLGDYSTCEEILNKVEKEISISFWSVEARFLLEEYKNGVESNWDTLSRCSKETSNAFVLFLIENFSKKVERKISYFRFRDLFVNKLEGLNAPVLVEYFCFRLSYSSYEGYQNFPFFLGVESNSPLVDRYLMLIDILFEGFATERSDHLHIFKEILQELTCFKGDARLSQMNALVLGEYDPVLLEASSSIVELFDLYTSGEFELVVTKAASLIKDYPSSIELYELYAKSLVYLTSGFKRTYISDLIDDVIESFYNIYSFAGKHQDSIGKLFKYSLSFQSSSWGKQVLGIATKYSASSQNSVLNEYLFTLNSNHANPRILQLAEKQNNFQKNFPNSIAYKAIKNVLLGNETFFIDNDSINKNKRFIYKARALFRLKKYAELVEHLENLSEEINLSKIEVEEKIQFLYHAYIEQGRFKDAIRLFVNESFNNKFFTFRLDTESLFNKIQNISDPEFSGMVEVPIFYRMYGTDSYEQYVAYDNFLINQGEDKPSQIEWDNSEKTKHYLYFLSEVCRIDVMQYSLEFEGVDDVEAERQSLLRILVKEDRGNEDEYIKEIAELTQGSKVRKAIREVNKGRITVNISQLRSIESANLEEGFLRYKELSSYKEKNIEAVGIDVTTKSITKYIESLIEEKKSNKNKLTNDPAFISFKSLFLDLRDKFLLSKEYGLDGYLSTRIRHGTLENHIRSVFENFSLIAERDKDGEYKSINYWVDKLRVSEAQFESLQKLLKKFSEKIDSSIQFLIQEQIQIYTDKYNLKPHALFNFNFTDDFLWVLFQFVQDNISDHDSFIDYSFSELQGYTESSLEKIRNYFKNDLNYFYLKELDSLQDSLTKVLDNSFPELNASLLSCRTEIQTELSKISDWFYLSNPTTNSVSDVETTLRTSVEITNSITPNHQLDAAYFGKLDLPIFGALHIIYISRILLDNIIKHSGIGTEKINVRIGAELPNENTLRLKFINELGDGKDRDTLYATLHEVKQKWLKKDSFEMTNKEGGSGFDKIRRILAFDLKGSHYGFDYEISDNKLTISIDVAIRIESHEEA